MPTLKKFYFYLLGLCACSGLAYYLDLGFFGSKSAPLPKPQVEEPQHPELSDPTLNQVQIPPEDVDAIRHIQAAFATGDYGRCLELAELFQDQKGRSPFFLSWLRTQMDSILTAVGWLKLKTGRCDQAIRYLLQAEQFGKSPEKSKGLAYCYYMNHYLDAAEEKILWFIANNKEPDGDVLSIYSEVLESKGRYSEATKILEILAAANKDPELKKKIAGMREKAKTEKLSQTVSTRSFSLSFVEEGYREIAERTLEFMEKALDELIDKYHFREPKKPIEVLLYREQDFQTINPNSPLWAEALFDGRIRVPLHQPYDLMHIRSVLRHELVHALFSQMTGARPLPNWFDEGLAQLASNCNKSCTPFSFGFNPGDFLSDEFFHKPFSSYKEFLAHKVYNQSLYLVLTLDASNRGALQTVVENIKIDSPLDSNALLQHVDTNFSELRKNAAGLWRKGYTFGAN